MHQNPARFRRALVALDGTATARRVVPWARRLVEPGGEIHLLTVVSPARAIATDAGTIYADQIESSSQAAVLAVLGTLASRLRADGVRSTGHIRFGEPARMILDTACEVGVDVIALTVGEGRSWWRWLTDGVTERVLRRARVPVLIARRHGQRGA
jgi:nucleotide-binding universal stress UspA family protein